MRTASLRPQELAYRTQYEELKDRVLNTRPLLPGTPGTLSTKVITGGSYCYRVYFPVPGLRKEEYVGPAHDAPAVEDMQHRIEFARWVAQQVRDLRKLGFQVGNKVVARVLVELYNHGLTDAGIVVVGTHAYMSLLNELGYVTVGSARTLDVDLAVDLDAEVNVEIAAKTSFLETLRGTGLDFHAVPGLRPRTPATALKLPGVEGLRIDVLADGPALGQIREVRQLQWHAQSVPYYDYLLDSPERSAVLAGDHCIPVYVPQPARFVWHKLHAAVSPGRQAAKAEKDRLQALQIACALSRDHEDALSEALDAAEPKMRKTLRQRLPGRLSEEEVDLVGL